MSRYELHHEIGRGGMAVVSLGSRRLASGSRQPVAIKQILPEQANSASHERFNHEADMGLRFDHPNIVRVYDYDFCQSRPGIVMEHVDGYSLYELAKRVTLPDMAVRMILGEALCALGYAHEQGVLHRDVSPKNILISRHGTVKLADFGLAKIIGSPVSDEHFFGTVCFASPEALHGFELDTSSDLYSLAATFYTVLTGQPPHGDEGYFQIIARQQRGDIAPLAETVGEDLQQIIMGLLRSREYRPWHTVEQVFGVLCEFCKPAWGQEQLASFLAEHLPVVAEDEQNPEQAAQPAQRKPTHSDKRITVRMTAPPMHSDKDQPPRSAEPAGDRPALTPVAGASPGADRPIVPEEALPEDALPDIEPSADQPPVPIAPERRRSWLRPVFAVATCVFVFFALQMRDNDEPPSEHVELIAPTPIEVATPVPVSTPTEHIPTTVDLPEQAEQPPEPSETDEATPDIVEPEPTDLPSPARRALKRKRLDLSWDPYHQYGAIPSNPWSKVTQ